MAFYSQCEIVLVNIYYYATCARLHVTHAPCLLQESSKKKATKDQKRPFWTCFDAFRMTLGYHPNDVSNM